MHCSWNTCEHSEFDAQHTRSDSSYFARHTAQKMGATLVSLIGCFVASLLIILDVACSSSFTSTHTSPLTSWPGNGIEMWVCSTTLPAFELSNSPLLPSSISRLEQSNVVRTVSAVIVLERL